MSSTDDAPDPEALLDLTRWRMPFGKYKGTLLIDLPEAYLAWFARQGFPPRKAWHAAVHGPDREV